MVPAYVPLHFWPSVLRLWPFLVYFVTEVGQAKERKASFSLNETSTKRNEPFREILGLGVLPLHHTLLMVLAVAVALRG